LLRSLYQIGVGRCFTRAKTALDKRSFLVTPLECSRLFLAAWEAASPAAISKLFADDGVFSNPLQPRPLVGPRQIFDAVSIGLGKIEDVRINVTSSLEQGPAAWVEGDFLSRKRADGSRFDFPFALALELRGDKISRLTEYFDTAPLR
jgi:ketosteroid isomerase-like protein